MSRYTFQKRVATGGAAETAGGADRETGVSGSIVITGFMGTGKTETGKALAARLGRSFVDTDEMIAERAGKTIPEIWQHFGESHFRTLERELCRELARRPGLVIATGGGTLVDDQNFDILREGNLLFILDASPATIYSRVGNESSRPLLAGGSEERLASLLATRDTAYRRIKNRVDTNNLSIQEAANQIATQIDCPLDRIETSPPAESSRSSILIGRGLLSNLGTHLRQAGASGTVFFLIAESIQDFFFPQITAAMERAGLDWETIPIRDGDGEKYLEQVSEVLSALAEKGAARDSFAVTVGGGVTGDLGGLAASLYMRGMRFVQVPTTLLAQVDASIGGKVGVNLPHAKNLVGNFYQPRLVLSDPCLLRTLPRRELANGMAEVIKTAMLGSQSLFDLLCSRISSQPDPGEFDIDFLEQCVAECAAIKAAVIERDPRERGERRILNLGHTVGHALEAIAGYKGLAHGEGVAIGLVTASVISARRGLVTTDFVKMVIELVRHFELPHQPPVFEREAFLRSLHLDKKKKAGRLRFVLPAGIGICDLVDDVNDDEVLAALREIQQ